MVRQYHISADTGGFGHPRAMAHDRASISMAEMRARIVHER
jgi:hypothetical protein